MSDYQGYRRDYGTRALRLENLPANPFDLFKAWLNEAISKGMSDATAFVLATAAPDPDARVVLLKEIEDDSLIFYTNYQSAKGRQVELNPNVAGCFYWPALSRQVRFKGSVTKIPRQKSEVYFKTRPALSQYSAYISHQSEVISSKEILEKHMDNIQGEEIECPMHWGGYGIKVSEFEFFQGRDNRLNDRFRATIEANGQFKWVTLAP